MLSTSAADSAIDGQELLDHPTASEYYDAESDVMSVKLFVGQVPRTMEEDEIKAIMEEFGDVIDIVIIKDKISAAHRGCAFVTFATRQAADACVAKLHNKVTLPPATNPLQVRPADGQGTTVPEHKLFIGMIPKSAEEKEIRDIFKPYGEIDEVYILRHQGTGQSKGCAFLKFKYRESANAAIDRVHGHVTMEGGSTTLVVKLADSRRQRMQRARTQAASAAAAAYWQMPVGSPALPYPQMQQQYIQQMQSYGAQAQNTPPASSSGYNMYGGHYNPYGYASYGYPAQGYGQAYSGPDEHTVAAASVAASAAPMMVPLAIPGIHIPPPQPSEAKNRSNGQLEGPIGANLFIYHLPHDLTDADLATAFAPFGTVISAKVYMDKNTGESKGFGFVSYDSVCAADAAISSMNGFQIGSKRLKVQHKRVNMNSRGDDDHINYDNDEIESALSSHGSGTGADIGLGSDSGLVDELTHTFDDINLLDHSGGNRYIE